MKLSSVQISVVVAIIQTSYAFRPNGYPCIGLDCGALKAVEEKVSLRLAIMQRLVGPKYQEKSK